MIFYGKQSIDEKDIEAVIDVLRSEFLTQGPLVQAFEKKMADYCDVKYAVAVTNATSALHIACLAADLKQGDVLWTSPNTFVASANCARYCGAEVDFVDINPKTYNMSIKELERKLETTKQIPKVVIPVHFAGQSCEMEEIHFLSKKYKFQVIEDASHAVGAEYKGQKIGSCHYSDMAVFSFHPVKIITTGEGGMILTNDEVLYKKLLLFRSHCITRDASLFQNTCVKGPWYYEQIGLGFNFRMTDIQAALGVSQMDQLPAFIARRRELAARYNQLLRDTPLILPEQHQDTKSSWHLYVVRLDWSKAKLTKNELFLKMKEKGISLNLHYIPVHLQPYYQDMGFEKGDFPCSESYYEEVFTLPLFYQLTDYQQDQIVEFLKEVLS